MEKQPLLPHLFRQEFRKITAVLTRLLGMENMAAAEDIASEIFLAAFETWPYKGMPENPVAWLYAVAKNKARNYIKHHQVFIQKVVPGLQDTAPAIEEIEIDLSDKNISDSQLQMLFAVCHPAISTEAQIGLALRILCGFGIEEIADALLTSKENVSKRLYRAKEKLRTEKVAIEFPGKAAINSRLETVLITLYLLFNEGYYSERQDGVLREALCLEAMRLTYLLVENEQTNQPAVNALLALMCFHASRFEARKNDSGEMILYHHQDETLWNYELVAKGAWFLKNAAGGNELSKYHLEASIAYWLTVKEHSTEKWQHVLQLYNQLLTIAWSPAAALNRIYALSKVKGNTAAIAEAAQLHLTGNHFYFTLLGELYRDIDKDKAIINFQQAFSLAKSNADRQTINAKIAVLKQQAGDE